jgi:hypothetical protein
MPPALQTSTTEKWKCAALHPEKWSSERLVLTLYWLFSGYGLRAWRPLVALLAVIAIVAIPLQLAGFQRSAHSSLDGLILAAGSSVGLSDVSLGPSLSTAGQILQIPLRVVGPVLIGLATFPFADV